MKINLPIEWQIAIGAVLLVLVLAAVAWFIFPRRPTTEEIERKRRTYLAVSGRIVDGMLLDFCEMVVEDGEPPAQMLVYSYRISGVDYECSQDVSSLGGLLKHHKVRAGFPCSVRYQPGNAQNSIVVAESWSGLREGLPLLPNFEDPNPLDLTARNNG
jgi:hypothetical protein